MAEKRSNLAFSADVTSSQELLKVILDVKLFLYVFCGCGALHQEEARRSNHFDTEWIVSCVPA